MARLASVSGLILQPTLGALSTGFWVVWILTVCTATGRA